ncbi:MAG TPA: hypothetical protein PLY32_05380 [Salinivirgaceae bacterium]|nr:hypothetical protein [Salinivirgaceae bacterium]HQA76532.1 hypothetical protein [Salinivirgaceae bacterium]
MFRNIIIGFLMILIICGFKTYSQEVSSLKIASDSLYDAFYNIRNINDFDKRIELSQKVETILDTLLLVEESFNYPFDTLKNMITCLYSDDKTCRIINWNIPRRDASYIYFCYIQHYDKENNKLTTTKLTDCHDNIEKAEHSILKHDNWYGTLYYEIVPTLVDKKEIVYVLLGWEGYSLYATKKIIDVMRFKNGKPYFGYEIFQTPSGKKSRVIFTYNYRAKMKLGWDKNIGMIVFDKLERIPTMPPNVEGNMAPTMLYDGLKWEDNVWKYKSNIDIKPNKKRRSKTKPYPYK